MAGILLEDDKVSDAERAAHARAIAAEKRAASLERAAEMKVKLGAQKVGKALQIPGTVLNDEIVPPGPYSRRIAAGNRFRIIDLEGQQAVDFLVYDAADPVNRYNAANTVKLNRSIYVEQGFKLYSDLGEVLMTLVEDTVGKHDTLGGCCSTEVNLKRYGIPGTASCRNNFIAALAEHGMSPRDIPANINFFMNVPVRPDGSTEIVEGLSLPGDFVDLRAEKDVLVVISNCPQLYNPCSGWNPTPIRLIEWRPSRDGR
jgi:urea carboxylase-associated protein 1